MYCTHGFHFIETPNPSHSSSACFHHSIQQGPHPCSPSSILSCISSPKLGRTPARLLSLRIRITRLKSSKGKEKKKRRRQIMGSSCSEETEKESNSEYVYICILLRMMSSSQVTVEMQTEKYLKIQTACLTPRSQSATVRKCMRLVPRGCRNSAKICCQRSL